MRVYNFERNLDIKLKVQVKQLMDGLVNPVYICSDGKVVTIIAEGEKERKEDDAD